MTQYSLNLVTGSYGVPLGFPVKASTTINKGAAVVCEKVTSAEGLAKPYVTSATVDRFLGFAEDGVDNSSGADKDKFVRVIPWGYKWTATLDGATDETLAGSVVYMSDDHTFTLSANDGVVTNLYLQVGTFWAEGDGGYYFYFQSDFLSLTAEAR